ncbi:MAG: polysaccharide pyruvyl transferase CsaB [Candidatus Gastranaerophilales bacterium]|nr:polysaccharide pyruvyl transferase CsaB [Candidatus Gastranaerophilales bacterium]
MKNVLVSGYIGFDNFGDEAIFYALSTHLKKMGYFVSVLCNKKQNVSKKYGVVAYNYKEPFEIFKAITSCDILISGGGSLLQNKTSNFSLFYYLLVLLFAKICFKKVIIFAQGVEPIIGKIPELFTRTILKLVDFISVRDDKSKELLESWKIKSNLVSDPAYSLVQDKEISKKEGLIVQLRSFKGMDDKLLSNLCDSIVKNYKDEVKVFSFQDEVDENICLKFVEMIKKKSANAKYISAKSIDETINIINGSKYMISTRLHGLIISNALQTKTFALCYDDKIKTIVEELNLENIDILNYSQDELNKKMDNFFGDTISNVLPYRRFEWDEIDFELAKQ